MLTRETTSLLGTVEDAWRVLFDESPTALLFVDRDSMRILDANGSAESCYGYGAGELNGVGFSALLDWTSTSLEVAPPPSDESELTGQARHRRRDGTAFDADVHARPLSANRPDVLVLTIAEVPDTDLRDPASGLPDLRVFIDRLDQDISHAHRTEARLTVCLLSIGHLENAFTLADPDSSFRLLREIALRLRNNIRESDTIARTGLTEFGLILDGVGDEKLVVAILRKIGADFEYEFTLGDESIMLDVTIGAAVYPRDGHDSRTLIESTRDALHNAHSAGPGRIEFYPTLS